MSAWLLPAATCSFWAGLLSWAARPGWFRPWMGAAFGACALIAAWLAAPDRRGQPDPDAPTQGSGMAAAVFLLAGVFVLALGWGGLQQARVDGSALAGLAPARVTLLGTLRVDPSPSTFGWSALVDVTRVESEGGILAIRETAWLSGQDDLPSAVRGDLVRLEGTIDRPEDPGFRESLRRKGIAVAIRLSELERIGGAPSPFLRATQVVRALVAGSIERLFPPKEAGLLLGLALGDESRMDPGVARDFRATGLGHLLVVSGQNVAMVLAPVIALVTWAGLGPWTRFVVCVATVAFFVALTGAEPSVMRAGVMATLGLVGVLMGRPRTTSTILAGAVFVLIVLDPWLVWSVGFQLSVAATTGIVTLGSEVASRLERHLPRPVALAAGTTVAAQLGVTPLLLFHFRAVPGATLAANLAAFPAVAPALLMGLAASAGGLLWMPVGRLLAGVALLPLRYLEGVADALGKAPVASITTRAAGPVLVAGVVLTVALAWWLRSGNRLPRSAVVAVVLAVPLLVWTGTVGTGAPGSLTVRFLDVGQGDAALVTSPAGATVLVDGGPDTEQVATELAALGVKRLDMVVASHPHADHVVGLPAVLARVPVGLLIQPGCPADSSLQDDLDLAIADEGVDVANPRTGSSYVAGDLRLDVLSPHECWSGTESDANNDALVVMLTHGEDSVLFATEPEEPAQQWLLDSGLPLRADVLKVPHHGAATSLPAFFEAARARVAVVSVGENGYGHPVPSTLAALEATGAQVWRTDEHGTITVTFQGGEPVVSGQR